VTDLAVESKAVEDRAQNWRIYAGFLRAVAEKHPERASLCQNHVMNTDEGVPASSISACTEPAHQGITVVRDEHRAYACRA